MRALLDTHLLIWHADDSPRLPPAAAEIIATAEAELFFSAVSIWEIAIKTGLGRGDFEIDAAAFRDGLLENGFEELPVDGRHGAAVAELPALHADPFDRLLIAQARVEGLDLLTCDAVVGRYPGALRLT
ncbi:MAG: type II toxin-antitoxin system VapC family toxin [Pseudomonadota bacterium]